MGLWRTRTLPAEQKEQIAEEQQDEDVSSLVLEDPGSVFNVENENMAKVYSAELPIDVSGLFSSQLLFLVLWDIYFVQMQA